jgi:hypothetical protein
MFTHNSVVCYLILCCFYSEVKIIKPKTSRNSNSERYLLCKNFIGINEKNKGMVNDIKNIITKFIFTEDGIYTMIYPYFEFTHILKLNKIKEYNNQILNEQIKTINESIKMVQSRDIYFQNLLINIFTDKITINYILFYKNILYERIKKSIEFLKVYKINTHQFVYRF